MKIKLGITPKLDNRIILLKATCRVCIDVMFFTEADFVICEC